MRVGFYNNFLNRHDYQNNNTLVNKPVAVNKLNCTDVFVKSKNISFTGRTSFNDLIQAAREGQAGTIKVLVKNNAETDLQDKSGNTALMYAVEENYEDIVKILLDGGADPNLRNNDRKTALMRAIEYDYTDMVKLLIDHQNTNLDVKDKEGHSALNYAVEKNNLNMIELLLKKGANINSQDNEGCSVLTHAVKEGSIDAVKLLIQKGADVNLKTNNGSIPILEAIFIRNRNTRHNSQEILELLLKNGADPNQRIDKDTTALMLASTGSLSYSKVDEIKLLLEHNADPDLQDDNGNTALIYATVEDSLSVIRTLLGHGADPSLKSNYGKSALDVAMSKGYPESAKLLTEAMENTNRTVNLSKSIKNIVKKNPNDFNISEVTSLLSEAEAKEIAQIKFKELENSTLLHILAKRRIDDRKLREEQLNLMTYLCKLGADINAQDENGNTSLHFAALKGDEDLVKLLLKNGADQNLENKFNCKPLFYAERGKHAGIVELIQDNKE